MVVGFLVSRREIKTFQKHRWHEPFHAGFPKNFHSKNLFVSKTQLYLAVIRHVFSRHCLCAVLVCRFCCPQVALITAVIPKGKRLQNNSKTMKLLEKTFGLGRKRWFQTSTIPQTSQTCIVVFHPLFLSPLVVF